MVKCIWLQDCRARNFEKLLASEPLDPRDVGILLPAALAEFT